MAKKDAMGKEIDSLYLSLGLNISDLELGFKEAGVTVKQAISRLNSEAKQIQLKADIDIAKLEAAGKPIDALRAKEKALNDELALQQKKLELLNRAYEANAKTYGKDSGITRGVGTKVLYQQRDIERLKASIAQVNAELSQTGAKATSAFGKVGAAASGAKAKVEGVVSGIGKFNAAIAGASAVLASGYGLFNITDKAMQAGENLYKLSQRLHTTTAEAGKLSKVFQLSGMDINAITPLLAKLDKQALAASKSSNDMADAFGEFGFSLTNSQGQLLSTEKQLEQLAKGYKKAAEAGKEEEFVAKVLGARGAALVPILQDWATNMEIVSRIKTTGLLNPKEAHELYIEWQAMQMQAGQLTGAIGQSLMPVTRELMPEINQGFKEFAQLIADNKDGIKSFGSAAGTAIGGLASSLMSVVSALGEVKKGFDDLTGASNDTMDVLRRNGFGEHLNRGKTAGAIVGGMIGSRAGVGGAVTGAAVGANIGEGIYGRIANFLMSDEEKAAIAMREQLRALEKADLERRQKESKDDNEAAIADAILKRQKKAAEVQKQLEKELAETTNKRLKEQLEATKRKVQASIEAGKDEEEAWLNVAQNITEAIVAAEKQAKEANEELEKSIYSLTHSDIQNTLNSIDYAAKNQREKGASEELVQREAELKKAKAIRQFEDETAAYLDNIYENSLNQRLKQIEREKRAWIKKGLDEVQATRAAEEQKRQATNDSIKNMFTSQKKYLDIYRKAMRGEQAGGYFYDFTSSPEARQQQAIKAIQQAMMKEAGVDPRERTTMAELQGFQNAMKGAEKWGLGLLKGGGDTTEAMKTALSESNAEITNLLGQINTGVPEINSNLSQILGAIQNKQTAPNVNVSPVINVDLGGAYVFDDRMKKSLTDDITNDVANAVSSAAKQAFAETNYSYGG